MHKSLIKFLLVAALAVATLVLSTDRADATWWRHHGSSGGSSGGYWGSSGGSSGGWYGSSGGSSGGYAYAPRLHHWGWRRHAYWGSSGGSSGGYYYGSSGGSSGGYYYGSSGGSSGGYYHGSIGGSSGGYVIQGAPVIQGGAPTTTMSPAAPGSPMPPAPPMPKDAAKPAPNTGTLNVRVPAEAKVFVNGLATTSTGEQRRYVSNGLEDGFNYTYELRAEIVRDGQTITETKVVRLKAGEQVDLSFGMTSDESKVAAEPVKTKLTLNVPADAKVFLSGNATHSTGEVREFTTTRLNQGETWNDYTVRVEFERDGRTMVEERKLDLAAGDNRELTVDFNVASLASATK